MGAADPRASMALLAAALLFLAPETPATGKPAAVEVESDSLRIDHGSGKAYFEGNVRAVYGDITLVCARLEVTYEPGGAVSSLLAVGGVQVQRGRARATAATARLAARSGTIVLEGQPVLVDGANRLEGRKITVDLHSGRIEVSAARGRFAIDLGNAP